MEVATKKISTISFDAVSGRVGNDYIVEAIGEEFLDKKLYFVCLLCGVTKEHSALGTHLSSFDHQRRFLVNNRKLKRMIAKT